MEHWSASNTLLAPTWLREVLSLPKVDFKWYVDFKWSYHISVAKRPGDPVTIPLKDCFKDGQFNLSMPFKKGGAELEENAVIDRESKLPRASAPRPSGGSPGMHCGNGIVDVA